MHDSVNIPILFSSNGFLPPMISYAQNFEDVTLRRAFLGEAAGFYVDVGAYHPVSHSVTNHFYLNGWRGLNIDPNPEQIVLFEHTRLRDVNLALAVGGTNGHVPLYVIADTGLTTVRRDMAESIGDSYGPTSTVNVLMKPLQVILDEHAGHTQIDFLKVDVEGAEYEVLSSCDYNKYRPRIILFECSDVERIHHLLTASGYSYAWFDGLNLYYVRHEDKDLLPLIARPPSVWDNITQLHR